MGPATNPLICLLRMAQARASAAREESTRIAAMTEAAAMRAEAEARVAAAKQVEERVAMVC